jgi:hypothetical protein
VIEQGDFNVDGQVTSADVPAMLKALADLNAYKSNKTYFSGAIFPS